MGGRLRSAIGLLVAIAVLALPMPAQGEEFSACWVTQVFDPWSGDVRQITRCRISGGTIVDYASDDDVPGTLYPQTGSDLTGQCWYYTSAVTQYVILAQYANGDADIGYDPDPAIPGGVVVVGPRIPRCTSEPTPTKDPTAEVWDYIIQYVHPPPTPDLNPKPGDGVTGLATYVGVPVPADHSARISSGTTTLEVFIEVSAVVVEWGDGDTNTYLPTSTALAGYPDGFATHVYEAKSHQGVTLSVSYDWTARWRILGGAWEFLAVPNTTTSVAYPIAEIVSVLSD